MAGYTGYGMTTHTPPDRETDFLSHFEELRARLLWCLLALAAALAAGWLLTRPAFDLLCSPIIDAVRAKHGLVMTGAITEAFFTKLKLAALLGILFASPVLLWQAWLFVRPALTERERRAAAPIAPAICLLFLLGAGFAYLMLPNIMAFFLSYIDSLPGVTPNLMLHDAIDFPMKVLLGFGIAFQLPVVLVALAALRVLSPAVMLRQWRPAVLALAILAAVITPTGDPFNWALLMAPLVVLYFGTVLVAARVFRPEPADGEDAA